MRFIRVHMKQNKCFFRQNLIWARSVWYCRTCMARGSTTTFSRTRNSLEVWNIARNLSRKHSEWNYSRIIQLALPLLLQRTRKWNKTGKKKELQSRALKRRNSRETRLRRKINPFYCTPFLYTQIVYTASSFSSPKFCVQIFSVLKNYPVFNCSYYYTPESSILTHRRELISTIAFFPLNSPLFFLFFFYFV